MASTKLGVINFDLLILFVAQNMSGVLFIGFTVYTSSSILNISTTMDARLLRERFAFPFLIRLWLWSVHYIHLHIHDRFLFCHFIFR